MKLIAIEHTGWEFSECFETVLFSLQMARSDGAAVLQVGAAGYLRSDERDAHSEDDGEVRASSRARRVRERGRERVLSRFDVLSRS